MRTTLLVAISILAFSSPAISGSGLSINEECRMTVTTGKPVIKAIYKSTSGEIKSKKRVSGGASTFNIAPELLLTIEQGETLMIKFVDGGRERATITSDLVMAVDTCLNAPPEPPVEDCSFFNEAMSMMWEHHGAREDDPTFRGFFGDQDQDPSDSGPGNYNENSCAYSSSFTSDIGYPASYGSYMEVGIKDGAAFAEYEEYVYLRSPDIPSLKLQLNEISRSMRLDNSDDMNACMVELELFCTEGAGNY